MHAHIDARIGFDDLGMVWFPRLPEFDLEVPCLEQRPEAEEPSGPLRKFRDQDLAVGG